MVKKRADLSDVRDKNWENLEKSYNNCRGRSKKREERCWTDNADKCDYDIADVQSAIRAGKVKTIKNSPRISN